jgi:hypothetical protein
MAVVITVAVLSNMATIQAFCYIKAMKNPEKPKESAAVERGRRAESLLAEIFEQGGWRVEREPHRQRSQLDMIVRRPGVVYGVEVKAAVEGRGDRLVPLFAQAVLQSLRGARQNAAPLAVVAAPKISQRAADQVLKFAEHYAPDAAAGVIDFEGLRLFRGPHPRGSQRGSSEHVIIGVEVAASFRTPILRSKPVDAEGTAGTRSSRGIPLRSTRPVQKRITTCGSR